METGLLLIVNKIIYCKTIQPFRVWFENGLLAIARVVQEQTHPLITFLNFQTEEMKVNSLTHLSKFP